MLTKINHEYLGNIEYDDEMFEIKNVELEFISESAYILANITNDPNDRKNCKIEYEEYLKKIGAEIINEHTIRLDILKYIGNNETKNIIIPKANHYIAMFMDSDIEIMPDISGMINNNCELMFADSAIKNIVIPKNIKTVPYGMFKNCYNAVSINIDHRAIIQPYAFSELFLGKIYAPYIICKNHAFEESFIVVQSDSVLRKYITIDQDILDNMDVINAENMSKSALNDMFSSKEKLDPKDMHAFMKGLSVLTKNLETDESDETITMENRLRITAYSAIMGSYINENNLYMQDYLATIDEYKKSIKNNNTDALRLTARVADLIDQKDRKNAMKAFEKMLSGFYQITDEINQDAIDKNREYLEARADIAATQPLLQEIIKNDIMTVRSNNYLKNDITKALLDEIFKDINKNDQDISELKNLRKANP